MKITRGIDETRRELRAMRRALDLPRGSKELAFVPTMGSLHRGHLSLVEEAGERAAVTAMSIFVNPTQFNDPKDFDTYPREIEKDISLAETAGVDLVFIPDVREMYNNPLTRVEVDELTRHLCGGHRPGHFTGVCTVVSKLFNIIQPDVAVFGQKDIQQAVIIEKMVMDLDFPVEIIVAPIVRESDGLAMSSRNARLSDDERSGATVIYACLKEAEKLVREGERDLGKITGLMTEQLKTGKPGSVDYVSAVGYDDLRPVEMLKDKTVIAIAAYFGSTRLIDNMIVEEKNGEFIFRY